MTKFEIFTIVRQIADRTFKFWSSNIGNPVWLIDQRESSVNPARNVTKQGIYLVTFCLRPDCLYTPWGEWTPWGEGVNSQKHFNLFTGKMRLDFFQPSNQSLVYKVLEFDGRALPKPELGRTRYNPESLKKEWERFKKRVMG